MFRFLKELFGKTAPETNTPDSAAVALGELEQWLKQARAPMNARLVEQLAATRSRIDQLAATIREKVSALQSAQLMNPDIPERAKDFMIGNREEYSRRVLQYLDKIPMPAAAEELNPFLVQHQHEAQEFTQGILRPFQILQEFFAHESKEITALLAEIEREIMSIKSLHEQAKPDVSNSLRADIQALIARHKQLKTLEAERAELEKQRNEAESSIKLLNSEEERLLKDPARQTALQKLNEAQQKVKEHEQAVRDIFHNFEPAMRKFYRMATRNVKLTERYLSDPVGTLVEDLRLDILEIIEDIKRLLKFDRLSLGDRRQYVLDALVHLTKEHLGTWMREYGQRAKAVKDAQRAIEECAASKTLERVQRLRDETRRNLQIADQRLTNIRKDMERIKLAELRIRLEAKIKDVTGATVGILL